MGEAVAALCRALICARSADPNVRRQSLYLGFARGGRDSPTHVDLGGDRAAPRPSPPSTSMPKLRQRSILALFGPLAALLTAQAAGAQSLDPPPVPPQNPITQEKAILGKILFWDEQLSSDGSIACGTCHIPSVGGGDPRVGFNSINPGPDGMIGTEDDIIGSPGVVAANGFGHLEPDGTFGLKRQVTGRHSPSFITAAWFDELFWDGRAKGRFIDPDTGVNVIPQGGALEVQSLGPLVSDVEMADKGRGLADLYGRLERARPLALATDLPADVAAVLAAEPSYPDLFQAAFGTPEINAVRLAFALATYQRTLVPDQSPYDLWANGDQTAMTPQQIDGFNAFNSVAICAVCHTQPLFSTGQFHSLALRPSSEDRGLGAITGNPADNGKFKTPSLRNVALKRRFFHNGAPGILTLRDSVAFYSGSGAFDNLDPVLNGFTMSNDVIDDVTAFLEALTDPRVANETFPFDRPTLRSERGFQERNPRRLGTGAVPGLNGLAPRVLVDAAPFTGADRFRLGLETETSNTFAAVRLRLVDQGGFGGPLALRAALPAPNVASFVQDDGQGGGYATWQFPLTNSPALRGVSLDAQWWVRDAAAAGGVAKSELVRITVE